MFVMLDQGSLVSGRGLFFGDSFGEIGEGLTTLKLSIFNDT